MEFYSKDESLYWILFDTISWEFKSIIIKKGKIFLQNFRELLVRAQSRLAIGEELELIAEEYTKLLKQNPNINSLYSYYEIKGYTFEKVLKEIEIRKEFFLKFQELTLIMNETFIELTKECQKKFYKEKIGKWILNNTPDFNEFREATTRTGQFDRFHILACMIFAIEKNRNTKFVTTDTPLMNKTNNIIDFYNNKKKVILEQIRRLEKN